MLDVSKLVWGFYFAKYLVWWLIGSLTIDKNIRGMKEKRRQERILRIYLCSQNSQLQELIGTSWTPVFYYKMGNHQDCKERKVNKSVLKCMTIFKDFFFIYSHSYQYAIVSQLPRRTNCIWLCETDWIETRVKKQNPFSTVWGNNRKQVILYSRASSQESVFRIVILNALYIYKGPFSGMIPFLTEKEPPSERLPYWRVRMKFCL